MNDRPDTPPRGSSSGGLSPSAVPMDPAQGLRRIKLAPHEMTERITPTRDVLVLAHLGVPRVDPASWSLAIDGLVAEPLTLTLGDVEARPKRIVEAVHQCCGSPTAPREPTRRVTNVRWGGVDLAALLGELGLGEKARYLWAFGLDHGQFDGQGCDAYVKDMPLARLAAGDVLLAYELNGERLPAEHGFPLRLVVPGYYGTNSVKWLTRLHLSDQRATGKFVSDLYNDPLDEADLAAGRPSARPVWAIAPESIIVFPAPDRAVAIASPTEIWGWAWSFRGVRRVEVSTDRGATWLAANLEVPRGWAWQRFSLPWRPATPGEVELWARATDDDGASQPDEHARNAIHRVLVVVH